MNKPVDSMTRDEKIEFISKYGEAKWVAKLNAERPKGAAGALFRVNAGLGQ
jgi:hypothetical protein